MQSKHYLHGGNLHHISRTYGINKEEIIDFSGNINPLGISEYAKKSIMDNTHVISSYPDRNYVELRKIVGKYCKSNWEHIVVGNGCSELIAMTIKALHPEKTLTVAPTYSEYERELKMIGGELEYYTLDQQNDFRLDIDHLCKELERGYDLFVLCNPNNPTSTVLTQSELDQILRYCKQHEIFVMIDETYIEFCDDPSKVTAIALVESYDNVLVLRGISKFFSAPGLRFGYGITANVLLKEKINAYQSPWSVNSIAELAVRSMLLDEDYINKTHHFFVQERARVLKILKQIEGLHVYEPKANFVLLKLKDSTLCASDIMEKLVVEKLLIRDASSFPSLDESYIRFCFLDQANNDRLLQKLEEILQ